MKAIVYSEYGSPGVLRCEEVEKPSPGEGQVLIRVHAAAVNPLDWHFLRGQPYPLRLSAGLRAPKDRRLGRDVSGRVESVGRNVTRFRPGDAVFGASKGAFAEYVCAEESALAAKPDNVSFEQAASVYVAALTALQALRDKGHLRAGQKVLVNGAAGGVGTFAVQIARHLGAEVTGVCSARNVEMVQGLGAKRVIDYDREDFTRSGERYDVILDCVGNHSLPACRRALARDGIHVAVGGPAGRWMLGPLARALFAPLLSRFGSRKFAMLLTRGNQADLALVRELMADGEIVPVIDRRYGLGEAAEAVRYLEAGHARGKVVITMQ